MLVYRAALVLENGIQDQLLSCDQFVHVRLYVPVESGTASCMAEATLDGFNVRLLLGRKERRKGMTEIVKSEPLHLISPLVPVMHLGDFLLLLVQLLISRRLDP